MKIFQIFYNIETKNQLDKTFIPFDNQNSKLNDWYEYSAIRDIFNNNLFEEDEYVGVFSPRFFEKTGLTGIDVVNVIENSNSEVISFSSRFDQIAYYQNSFYQGEYYHPGLIDYSSQVISEIGLDLNIKELVSDQTRIIFSNYFVAKYSFWKKFIIYAERLMELASSNSMLSNKINNLIMHRPETNHSYKVFIMERLVSAILESLDINAEIGFDYTKFLEKNDVFEPIFSGLLMLDSYKSMFLKTRKYEYLTLFEFHKQQIPLNKMIHGFP